MRPSTDFYFSHARTALKYGLIGLGFNPGDELLLPSFICDVVIDPLKDMGILPRYYPVTSSLEPDWHRLSTLVGPKARGFLIVHYFGFPQDLTQARKFCRDHGLFLIEDNAHGYGGTFEGQRLGSFGEIGISSPRKSFGWRNGGVLHWNVDNVPSFQELPVQPGVLSWTLKKMLKKELYPLVTLKRRFKGMPNYASQDIGRETPIPDWTMDVEYVHKLKMHNEDLEDLISKRRRAWEIWREWAEKNSLTSIFSTLSAGTNPLVFPVRTRSFEESQRWFRWGWERGVNVHSWPTLPWEIVENDPQTLNLWKTFVCFPIEVGIESEKLRTHLGIECDP